MCWWNARRRSRIQITQDIHTDEDEDEFKRESIEINNKKSDKLDIGPALKKLEDDPEFNKYIKIKGEIPAEVRSKYTKQTGGRDLEDDIDYYKNLKEANEKYESNEHNLKFNI